MVRIIFLEDLGFEKHSCRVADRHNYPKYKRKEYSEIPANCV